MLITVGICTWNRASILEKCLKQLQCLVIPDSVSWELIVVNNNSTDHTRELLNEYSDRLPLRTIFEPRQGKSHALNTAISQAQGEWILWTDDDVLVDPNWLVAHLEAIEKFPQSRFFGGPIRPLLESCPPAWIVTSWQFISNAFAELDLGSEVLELDPHQHAFGANFAIQTEIQRQFKFDTSLGRVAENQIRCEETELQLRLMSQGIRGFWNPTAVVQHIIPSERMTHNYIRAWQEGIGESTGILKNEGAESSHGRASRMLLLQSRLYSAALKYWVYRYVLASQKWGKYYSRIGFLKGRIRRLRSMNLRHDLQAGQVPSRHIEASAVDLDSLDLQTHCHRLQ